MTRPQLYTVAAVLLPQLAVWGWWLAWEFWAWWRWGGQATISSSFSALIRCQPWASIGSAIVVAFAHGLVAGHILEMVKPTTKQPSSGDQPDEGFTEPL